MREEPGGRGKPAERKKSGMTQPGEITQIRGNMMQVTFCRPEACAACNACEGGKKEHSVWIRAEGNVGDIAVVEMPDRVVAQASFLAYGMPLAALLIGMTAGNLLSGGSNGGTAAGAAAGLAAGMILLGLSEKKRRSQDKWSPKVIEIREKKLPEEKEA